MKISLIAILGLLLFTSVSAQSPGGVSSDLLLWLDANSGVSVSGTNVVGWTNQAPTAMTSQASRPASSAVTLHSGDFNYNPVLLFDGSTNGVLQGRYASAPNNPSLIFAAVKKMGLGTGCCRNVYSQSPGGAAGLAFATQAGINDAYSLDGSGFGCSSTPNAIDQLAIVRVDYQAINSAAGGFSAFNGTVSPPCISGPLNLNPPNGVFQVGGRTYNSGAHPNRIFDGQIAEIIHYNSNTTNGTEVQQIESYLAIKYGVSLSTNYLNSAGATIYDVSSFGNGIIGLARDDDSKLLQKQSHPENDSTRIYLSTLQTENANNSGTFSSNFQSLLMGHDNRAMRSEGSTEFPPALGIFSRLEREWKITNTSFDGSFSLDFKLNTTPINPIHLRMLVDIDDNLTDAVMISPTISFSGGVVTISGLSNTHFPINSTRYFTIVSLNSLTPLPLTLVSFDVSPVNNELVKIDWQTTREESNNFFTVEKSQEGTEWDKVALVKGAGWSSALLSYKAID